MHRMPIEAARVMRIATTALLIEIDEVSRADAPHLGPDA